MNNIALDKKSAIVLDKSSFAEVCVEPNSAARFLRSTVRLKKGSIITPFKAKETFKKPDCYTIQIDQFTHISLSPYILKYTNHSCDPNVFFDTKEMKLVAIKDIEQGEELCYFYPSTELNMSQPFTCSCGKDCCLGEIGGAVGVPKDVLKKYKVSGFIKSTVLENEQ